MNAGLYAFDAGLAARGDRPPHALAGHRRALSDPARRPRRRGRRGRWSRYEAPDDGTLDGINDRVQLAEATAVLRERINVAWMRAGVTMLDPATAFVDAEVELAPDVTLEPNVILRGRTRVGEGTVIGAGSQLVDTVVGPRLPRLGQRPGAVRRSRRGRRSVRSATCARGAPSGPASSSATSPRSRTAASRPGVKQHHVSYLGRRPRRRGDERRGGDDHRQLRRRPQAPHRDREGRLPRRRHDAARPDHARRRGEDRRRRRRHQGRPAGQARRRRPGAPPRPAARLSPPVDPASGPAAHDEPAPAHPTCRGLAGAILMDILGELLFIAVLTLPRRASSSRPRSPSSRSDGAASTSSWTSDGAARCASAG